MFRVIVLGIFGFVEMAMGFITAGTVLMAAAAICDTIEEALHRVKGE
nr:hypothetical protein [Sphingomonas sp. Y57]